jgi:hypothetical protein
VICLRKRFPRDLTFLTLLDLLELLEGLLRTSTLFSYPLETG